MPRWWKRPNVTPPGDLTLFRFPPIYWRSSTPASLPLRDRWHADAAAPTAKDQIPEEPGRRGLENVADPISDNDKKSDAMTLFDIRSQGGNSQSLRTSIGPSREMRRGLHVRFVTRMSGELSEAVKLAAHREGITAGAWVRRTLLERIELRSEVDERSGRPLAATDEELADLATAIRELAGVSAAVSIGDRNAAKNGLNAARSLLIPMAVRRSRR